MIKIQIYKRVDVKKLNQQWGEENEKTRDNFKQNRKKERKKQTNKQTKKNLIKVRIQS